MTNIKITTFEHDGKTYELVTDPDSIKVGQDVYLFGRGYENDDGSPKRQEVITSSDHYTDFGSQAKDNLVYDWVNLGIVYTCTTPVQPVGRTSSSELLHPHQKLIDAKKKYPDLVIEFLNWYDNWTVITNPCWDKDTQYRIQPKREVKYHFVYETFNGGFEVSMYSWTEDQFKVKIVDGLGLKNYTRLDWTKQVIETPVEIPE